MQKNVIIAVLVILAGVFYFKGKGGNANRVVIDEEIVTDPNFDKLPQFLGSFNDCMRSDKAISECEGSIVTNDDVFKDSDSLKAALPAARAAMKEMTSIEFLRPSGKVLKADTDQREVFVYAIDGVGKYQVGGSRIHYSVVTQGSNLKINGYVIDRAPQAAPAAAPAP